MPRLLYEKNKGIVTLSGILILGGIAILLAGSLIVLSIYSLKNSQSYLHKSRGLVLNHACAEEALYQIRLNSNFTTSSSSLAIDCGGLGNQGPNNSGTQENDASSGSHSWLNPENSITSNNSYAQVTVDPNNNSYILKITNFGFNVPVTATIDGFLVEVEKRQEVDSGIGYIPFMPVAHAAACCSETMKDFSVRLIKGGVIGGGNKADTVAFWPTVDTYFTYGNPSDLWSQSWTPANVNASNFGIAFQARNISAVTAARGYVDHIRVTVYYNTGGAGPCLICNFAVINCGGVDRKINVSSTISNVITKTEVYARVDSNSTTISRWKEIPDLDLSCSPPNP